jgi:hypothetical protein
MSATLCSPVSASNLPPDAKLKSREHGNACSRYKFSQPGITNFQLKFAHGRQASAELCACQHHSAAVLMMTDSKFKRRSEELFFSEKNYSAVRHAESDPRLI